MIPPNNVVGAINVSIPSCGMRSQRRKTSLTFLFPLIAAIYKNVSCVFTLYVC